MRLVKPARSCNSHRLFGEILHFYGESHRHYHNLSHLAQCFQVLDSVMAKLPGILSVELALWYHDIVYDTTRADNEERSALFAEERIEKMGKPRAFALQVGSLVRATSHRNKPHTREAQVLLDVDLSIFAESPERVRQYDEDIRREYSWVPEEHFYPARFKLLQRFREEGLYSTPEFLGGPREELANANLDLLIQTMKDTVPSLVL